MGHLACKPLAVVLVVVRPLAASAAGPAQPAALFRLLSTARRVVNRLDMQAFSKISAKPAALIVDARETGEFAAGCMPGAVNIPPGMIEFRITQYLGHPEHTGLDREICIYCARGSRAVLAAASLLQPGFSRMDAVDMHLVDWKGAGHPLMEPGR